MSPGAEASAAAQRDRFALIDGLRGVAAIAILFYHYMHFSMGGADHGLYDAYRANQPLRALFAGLYDYGFYAVELFWMISGFVFAAVYLGREASTREFIVNRIARLYPLHLLTLLVVTALQFAALARLGHTLVFDNFDLPHFLAQLVFASDWIRGSGNSFNTPIWSVSVEVVVYALFWSLRGRLRRMGAAGLAALILASLLACAVGTVSRIPACAFYFFSGTALYRAHAYLSGRGAMLWPVAAALVIGGGAGIAAGGAFAREVIGIPLLGGATILALARLERVASMTVRSAAEWLGDCTYGIYLWHVPLQLLLLSILAGERTVALTSQPWFLPVWITGIVAWARISFVLFERPAREGLRRLAKPVARHAAPAAAKVRSLGPDLSV